MALSPGDRIGHYVISSPLGAGGMGEVYRAQDTRLGRDVALKVLPEEFAADSERLARFEREARLLASLSHPNIATLYGLETTSSTEAATGDGLFLAMELVEGDDLEGRIAKGRTPVNEAVAIGKQIAEGLEAAHAKGIVHRDLKPANVRITPAGTVKILDFGLAKEWGPSPDGVDVAESPTITAEMTREGTILGTAPYMSPEQARTRETDKRTDIWALGCVLYEMLAGRRAFDGDTWPEILAHILERDPEWDALPPDVPPALRRLLARCLERDPRRRLRDAGDVALALEDLEYEQPPTTARDTDRRMSSTTMKVLPWLIAAAAALVAVVAWVARPPAARPGGTPTLRFSESSPAALDITQIGHSGAAVAVSPSGELLVWVAATEQGTQLYLRRLDEPRAHPIADTEGALAPFFSPDSEWIGFWADGRLKKVAVSGGVAQTICEIDHVHGASWGDGIIVIGAVGGGTLYSVDPGGGEIRPIVAEDGTAVWGEFPRLLPGSRQMSVSRLGRNAIDLVSLENGESTTLVGEGVNGSYLPSGHLVWAQQDNLLAAPFDLSHLTITGDARTVVEGVLTEASGWVVSHYAVSDTGTLVYLPGTFEQAGARPTWVTLDGAREPLPLPTDTYLSPRVSPDGKRMILSRQGKTHEFWVAEPERGIMSPITGDEGEEFWGIWTPDGTGIVFNSIREDGFANIWTEPVDRSSPAARLTTAPLHQPPADITHDGRAVLFESAGGTGENVDIQMLDLDSGTTTALLDSHANEIQPKLSPDERWLAYASDVSGRLEVYVQSFPDMGATVRVSPNGGQEPLWSPAGDRLYYRSQNGRLVFAVDVTGDPPRFGREQLLFEGNFAPGIRWGRKWDIHPDGKRFLMLPLESAQSPEEIRVVVNWFTELERLVPAPE